LKKVHPLAFVDPTAELGEDVEVGPYAIIEAGAVVGARTRIDGHAVVRTGTSLGTDNYIGTGCVLGGDPQDHGFKGESSYLRIGDQNIFREYVTVHRASGEGNSTVVGNQNLIMAYTHLGHNVTVGNSVNIANNVGVSGHVTIEDLATLGGMTGIHQFVRIGKVAMLGGMTRTVRDVPPFMTSSGQGQEVHDINAVGLRRIGVSPQERMALHRACKLLYRSQLGLSNAIEIVRREVPLTAQVLYLLEFEQRRFNGKHGRGDQP
jgi:UDP-N-acetylglucosamine acyltransferase